MKIKLTHLIIASLMLLGVVFSSAGNVFSATRQLKRIDSSDNTTSASGLEEDLTTQMNYDVVNTLVKYDPAKHDPVVSTLLDVEIDVARINSETVEVTIRNTSQVVVNDDFWMTFYVFARISGELELWQWKNEYRIPHPHQETKIHISSAEVGYLSEYQWKFYVTGAVDWDRDITNNHDSVCSIDNNCP